MATEIVAEMREETARELERIRGEVVVAKRGVTYPIRVLFPSATR